MVGMRLVPKNIVDNFVNIPFIDLKTQFKRIEPAVNKNIERVLSHGQYIMGPEIQELEQNLAKFCSVKHAISCSSGTDALLMALMAYDIGPGDAIFTTPFTFFATAEVISLTGATPIFVDIDPKTFNIDPQQLEKTVCQVIDEGKYKARGIIPVNLFGLCPDFDAINKIAKNNDLFVVEDTAQGFGGTYKGKTSGSLGDISATSFFPAKPLGCYGDGGAVFTDDDDLANKIISLRVHGMGEDKYDNVRIGLNARMDSLQAAILLPKLEIFAEEIEMRQKVARRYSEKLSGLVEIPYVPEDYESVWAQYSVMSDDRESILESLKEKGIPTAVYYRIPIHLSDAYKSLGYESGDMPISEACSKRIFSLPMHPYLDPSVADKVASIIRSTINQ